METADSEKIFLLSRLRIAAFGLIALVFCISGVFIYSKAHSITRYPPVFIKATAITAIVFFGVLFLYIISRLRNPVALKITAKGIYNNSNAAGPCFIPWEDVQNIETAYVRNTRFLLLHVFSPDGYIKNAQLFKKWLMIMNYRMYGTPLSISMQAMNARFDDVTQYLHDAYIHFKNSSTQHS